jgi:hypothetical protein
VHLACTIYLTHMHTGDRSAEAIDAGQVLPGYSGVIVRDGYAGYGHLTDALHAWCGAHLLRDLKGLYGFEPQNQEWASRMADLLIEARAAAAAARLAGQPALEPAVLEDLLTRYRALTTAGLAANLYRRTATAKDARRKRSGPSGRSRSSSEAPAAPGAPSTGSLTSPSSSPTIWWAESAQTSNGVSTKPSRPSSDSASKDPASCHSEYPGRDLLSPASARLRQVVLPNPAY